MNIVRKSVKKLTQIGSLKRYDTGIYFLPSTPYAELDIKKVVESKYVHYKGEYFGYFYAGELADKLKQKYKYPEGYDHDAYDVVSNKATGEYRELKIAGHKIVLRKPKVEINKENHNVLQFLDMLKDIEIRGYIKPKKEETVMLEQIDNSYNFARDKQSRMFTFFMKKENITMELLNRYLEFYPSKVVMNLYLLGFLQVLQQKEFNKKYKEYKKKRIQGAIRIPNNIKKQQ